MLRATKGSAVSQAQKVRDRRDILGVPIEFCRHVSPAFARPDELIAKVMPNI